MGRSEVRRRLCLPYVEKGFHGAVAVSYRVPETGKYNISATLTDANVAPQFRRHDGFNWRVEVAKGGSPGKVVGKGGPVGDGKGRPDSVEVKIDHVEVAEGELIRVTIDPIKWWGSNLTKIEGLKIERADG
ncbi:MAG: hypothetical protein MI757_02635 [Pirellulales bacterium]|nr:hypothetical protein [Pirellulales bacterium]